MIFLNGGGVEGTRTVVVMALVWRGCVCGGGGVAEESSEAVHESHGKQSGCRHMVCVCKPRLTKKKTKFACCAVPLFESARQL